MPAADLIGRTIGGKFAVESFLGGGGMGAVYRARQVDLDKVVAIKVLHPELLAESTFAARFKREAKAASRIDHPNSMRVIDFGQEPDGLLYIAMEYLEGRNLHQIIHQEAPLEPARIADLLRQVLAALAAAHDLQIVHRDLKPENIIVLPKTDDDGSMKEVVKVCDFGIAKFTAPHTQTTGEKLTTEGTIIGTPDYLSPEQARGETIDPRSDLYSVGVILYEMLTGKTPFSAETPLAIVLKHLTDEPKPPSELNPHVDRNLEAVCLKAMAKGPDARFATAREMRAVLIGEGPFLPRVTAPTPPGARGLVLVPDAGSYPRASSLELPRATEGLGAPLARRAAQMLESEPPPPLSVRTLVGILVALGVAAAAGTVWFRSRAVPPAPPPAMTTAPSAQELPTDVPKAPPEAPQAPPPPSEVAAAADPIAVPRTSASSPRPARADSKIAPPVSRTPVAEPSPPSPPPSSSQAATPQPSQPQPSPAIVASESAGARVTAGAVSTSGVNPDDVRNALPLRAFTQCYRDGFAGRSLAAGAATLELEITNMHTEAVLKAPDALGPVLTCIARAAKSMNVHNVSASGTATAEVELVFKPL